MPIAPSQNDSRIDDALQRISRGETALFEVVLRRSEGPLRAWLVAHVRLGVSANEIAQRSFVAAFSRLGCISCQPAGVSRRVKVAHNSQVRPHDGIPRSAGLDELFRHFSVIATIWFPGSAWEPYALLALPGLREEIVRRSLDAGRSQAEPGNESFSVVISEKCHFFVHFFPSAVNAPSQLDEFAYSSQKQSIQFCGLAVGIDLSDLGYASGETIEGLFFQDALDDGHRVDPVFIAGLPEMK